MISYEEFRKRVIERFTELSQALTAQEIENYFKNDEDAIHEIKSRYEAYSERYEKGELPDNLIPSCVASVAYCLYMMY